MCWGRSHWFKKCPEKKKKIPADPLTRPPFKGRSAACPHPLHPCLHHPFFENRGWCFWILLFLLVILLIIGLVFFYLYLPSVLSFLSSFHLFCFSTNDSNGNPFTSSSSGGGRPSYPDQMSNQNEKVASGSPGRGPTEDRRSMSGQRQRQRPDQGPDSNFRIGSRSSPLENYAECVKGAFIHRVLNFPPFRGYESERGTLFILLEEPLNPNTFWSFNPPGIVQIALSQPVFITGMTLKHVLKDQHPLRDLGNATKNFELYAFNDISGEDQLFLGRFTFTDYMMGRQTFFLKTPTRKKFAFVELRFLNSQSGKNFVNVYKVEIHGNP